MVMASPPQTYLALMSVTAMFLYKWLVGGLYIRRNACSILDDNVASTANNTETTTLDDTGRALTEEGLVRGNSDTQDTSVVAKNTLAGNS
jgi:hypothetical protein